MNHKGTVLIFSRWLLGTTRSLPRGFYLRNSPSKNPPGLCDRCVHRINICLKTTYATVSCLTHSRLWLNYCLVMGNRPLIMALIWYVLSKHPLNPSAAAEWEAWWRHARGVCSVRINNAEIVDLIEEARKCWKPHFCRLLGAAWWLLLLLVCNSSRQEGCLAFVHRGELVISSYILPGYCQCTPRETHSKPVTKFFYVLSQGGTNAQYHRFVTYYPAEN